MSESEYAFRMFCYGAFFMCAVIAFVSAVSAVFA